MPPGSTAAVWPTSTTPGSAAWRSGRSADAAAERPADAPRRRRRRPGRRARSDRAPPASRVGPGDRVAAARPGPRPGDGSRAARRGRSPPPLSSWVFTSTSRAPHRRSQRERVDDQRGGHPAPLGVGVHGQALEVAAGPGPAGDGVADDGPRRPSAVGDPVADARRRRRGRRRAPGRRGARRSGRRRRRPRARAARSRRRARRSSPPRRSSIGDRVDRADEEVEALVHGEAVGQVGRLLGGGQRRGQDRRRSRGPRAARRSTPGPTSTVARSGRRRRRCAGRRATARSAADPRRSTGSGRRARRNGTGGPVARRSGGAARARRYPRSAVAVLFVTHPRFLDHDAGRGHPERPARLTAVLEGIDGRRADRGADARWRRDGRRPRSWLASTARRTSPCSSRSTAPVVVRSTRTPRWATRRSTPRSSRPAPARRPSRPSTRARGTERVLRGAPAGPPRHAVDADGLLPPQQRRGGGRGAGRPRRAGADRRLRRAPRQRHPGRVLVRPPRGLRLAAPAPALPGHRRPPRDGRRRRARASRSTCRCPRVRPATPTAPPIDLLVRPAGGVVRAHLGPALGRLRRAPGRPAHRPRPVGGRLRRPHGAPAPVRARGSTAGRSSRAATTSRPWRPAPGPASPRCWANRRRSASRSPRAGRARTPSTPPPSSRSRRVLEQG